MKHSSEIRDLRERTHASLGACAKAIEDAGGDVERALKLLQERGLIIASGRARVAREGRVHTYVHGASEIAVMVEVNCETDFAARSDLFKGFCDIVAMQVAATSPRWVRREDIPAEALVEQRASYEARLAADGKPRAAWDKIIAGKIEKWYGEVCLSEQKALASETPNDTIETHRALLSSKLGETISIRRFQRWAVGEGITEPKKEDYAAQVAVVAGAGTLTQGQDGPATLSADGEARDEREPHQRQGV